MKNKIQLILIFLLLMVRISNAQQGQWTWMKGDSTNYSPGYLISQSGVFDASNHPQSNYEPSVWTDKNGNFWLYGGQNPHFVTAEYNQLFEFNPLINEWAIIRNANNSNPAGVYGNKNVANSINTPGARGRYAPTWVDTSGNLWMFGGWGYDKDSVVGGLNDLWMYNISSNEWTWIAGPDTANDPGNYGTIMIPSPTNNPPSRFWTNASWTDDNNNLWLYGGFTTYGTSGHYSDLWKFNIATKEWTWMKGSNLLDQPPVYGTKGIANSTNDPGGRWIYSHWKDGQGNFWLFGGSGVGNTTNTLNDMWKFNPSTNEWTWINGPNLINNIGEGSTLCSSTINNLPSSRYDNGACWTLDCNNFAFFGGSIDSTSNNTTNDLWNYNVSSNKWTIMSGSLTLNDTGNFGIKQVSSPLNMPGSRSGAVGWKDNSGNLWMFCGRPSLYNKIYSDLWKFVPDTSCPALCNNAGIPLVSTIKNEISIYPNPSNSILHIHSTVSIVHCQLSIINVLGEVIHQETWSGMDNSIDVSKWSAGVYFYQLLSDKETYRGKFVVQK